MFTKFHVKDYSQDKQHNKGRMRAFGGNDVETASNTLGLCETVNSGPEVVQEMVFTIKWIHTQTQIIP